MFENLSIILAEWSSEIGHLKAWMVLKRKSESNFQLSGRYNFGTCVEFYISVILFTKIQETWKFRKTNRHRN